MTDRAWLHEIAALPGPDPAGPVAAALRDLVLDTVAIAAGARLRRTGATAADTATVAPLPPGKAQIWGAKPATGPAQAAFLNGTAAEVLDFQEVLIDGRNNGHAAVVIVPALIGLAQARGIFGPRLLAGLDAAFVANLVLMRVLGRGHREGEPGFRTTSLGAPVAAAIGGALLLGLDPDRVGHAAAIAASALPAGLLAAMAPEQGSYSTDKDLAVGWGAQHAVQSVLAAEAGATGPAAPLTGRKGWLASFGFGTGDTSPLEAPLPRDAALAYAIKRYPANFGCQAAARAAVELHASASGRSPASVEIRVKTSSARSLSTRSIVNHLAARFSLPYVVASSLARGRCRLEDFDEPALADPAVAEILGRCTLVADDAMEAAHRARGIFPARITVAWPDGETSSVAHEGPWEGMAAAERAAALGAKAAALLEGHAAGDAADRLVDAVALIGTGREGPALAEALALIGGHVP